MDEIIEILCLRYLEKIKDKNFGENEFSKDHIEKMLNELLNNKSSWSEDKLNRWLGYVQGVLTVFKIINVEEEREFTRPLFHNYYKKNNLNIPETLDLKN